MAATINNGGAESSLPMQDVKGGCMVLLPRYRQQRLRDGLQSISSCGIFAGSGVRVPHPWYPLSHLS